jgi:biotin transport system substrate-specific component
MKKINTQMTATAIAQCSIFVVLMMLTGVVIKIPFPLVPLTFQTVVCVLAGLLLGWKKGGIAMLAYTILGLVGLPVFAAGGGIFYVVKPSFGYILGFIAGAVVAGLVRGKSIQAPLWRYMIAAVAAFAANYAVGIVYFIAVWQLSGYAGLGGAIVTYNLIYMPKDIVLCLLAALLSQKLAPMVLKRYLSDGDKA